MVQGLLDPCTNSKIAPNIPAELLYDRRDDGLRLQNSWAGYHIILNPPYKSQVCSTDVKGFFGWTHSSRQQATP